MNTERLPDWIPVSIGCGSLVVEGHVDKKWLKNNE